MKIVGVRDTKTRQNLYVEVLSKEKQELPDGRNGILDRNTEGILGQVIDAYKPLIPVNGGVGEQNFIIITPANKYFYAFDYSKDLEGWKQQIEKGAEIVGVRLAKIVDEKYFVISDGTTYPLVDCEFERYNFYYKDEKGEHKIHKERERISKRVLFPEYYSNKSNTPYKTYQGKDYTKEEWEKYEQEQWDLHKKHSKYQSEEDIEEEKKKLGSKGFFLDEKESDI